MKCELCNNQRIELFERGIISQIKKRIIITFFLCSVCLNSGAKNNELLWLKNTEKYIEMETIYNE